MSKKFFLVSRNKDEAIKLASNDRCVGFIENNKITFYPDDITISMKESETLLNKLDDRDIVDEYSAN